MNANVIITSYHLDNKEYYTTKEVDELIPLVNSTGLLRDVSSCTINAYDTDLLITACNVNNDDKVTIFYESDKLFIPSLGDQVLDNVKFDAIKVYGAAGQKISWEANAG